MAQLTKEYLDQKLQEQTEAIMGVVKQSFDDTSRRIDKLEELVASLVSSVDRFVKIAEDIRQETVVLQKQLRDLEGRVDRLEAKVHRA